MPGKKTFRKREYSTENLYLVALYFLAPKQKKDKKTNVWHRQRELRGPTPTKVNPDTFHSRESKYRALCPRLSF
jgi:hypothetical protein